MGEYTRLELVVKLKNNKKMRDRLFSALAYATGNHMPIDDASIIDHPLFRDVRLNSVFTGKSSYFKTQGTRLVRDTISGQYTIHVSTSIKNSAGSYESFLDWISQYVDAKEGQPVGFMEFDNTPPWPIIVVEGGLCLVEICAEVREFIPIGGNSNTHHIRTVLGSPFSRDLDDPKTLEAGKLLVDIYHLKKGSGITPADKDLSRWFIDAMEHHELFGPEHEEAHHD